MLLVAECGLIVAYVALFVHFVRRSKLFAIYTFLFVSHLGVLVSIALIDNLEIPWFEVHIGPKNNSFLLYFLFALLSIVVVYLASRTREDWVSVMPNTSGRLFYIGISIMTLPLLWLRLKGGGVDRFNAYEGLIAPGFFATLHSVVDGLFVYTILGAQGNRQRLQASVAMLILDYLVGATFGPFIYVLSWYFIALRIRGQNISKRFVAAGMLAIFAAVGFKAASLANTEVSFIGRMALQGEMFYALVGMNLPAGFVDATALAQYASSFFSMDTYRTTPEYGFGKLMYVLMGPDAIVYMDNNVRLATGYPAMIMYHTNFVVTLIINVVLLIAFVGVFVRLLFWILKVKSAILFALFYKVYIIYASELLVTGDYGQIRFKAFALFMLVVAYMIVVQLWRSSGPRSTVNRAL